MVQGWQEEFLLSSVRACVCACWTDCLCACEIVFVHSPVSLCIFKHFFFSSSAHQHSQGLLAVLLPDRLLLPELGVRKRYLQHNLYIIDSFQSRRRVLQVISFSRRRLIGLV